MSDKWLLFKATGGERQRIATLVRDAGVNPDSAKITLLAGDGSERRFLRVVGEGRSLIVILPTLGGRHGVAESRAAWFIGKHLRRCGVPVPEMHGYDPETGILVCEDLGDRLLHREVVDGHCSEEQLVSLYEPVIESLARMQMVGRVGFNGDWCWDTKVYDRQLMLARESGYFWESCCRQFLGVRVVPVGLPEEFGKLADLASALPAGFFLHRDFQSRNIMISGGCHRVIDFQGGRLGPLGYDLASLLNDPYVALPEPVKDRLVQKYIEVVNGYPGGAAGFTVAGYYLLALQRNLQILGAFAFLVKVREKSFFRDYLRPAALGLHKILNEPAGQQFPVLGALAAELPGMLDTVLS